MKKSFNKTMTIVFGICAVALSNVMCAVVAYNYSEMLCGGNHKGYSAPPEVSFLLAIPFAVGICICAIISAVFYRKSKSVKGR